jgi:hypothetical protein
VRSGQWRTLARTGIFASVLVSVAAVPDCVRRNQ